MNNLQYHLNQKLALEKLVQEVDAFDKMLCTDHEQFLEQLAIEYIEDVEEDLEKVGLTLPEQYYPTVHDFFIRHSQYLASPAI